MRSQTCAVAGDVEDKLMLDILMLGLGLSFFALAVGYVAACERL